MSKSQRITQQRHLKGLTVGGAQDTINWLVQMGTESSQYQKEPKKYFSGYKVFTP